MKRLIVACCCFMQLLKSDAQQKPNVVFIYADDLGYGDLSCYGSAVLKTPNIDKLAAQGVRFTNAHASSPTCTPSRYALMTGRYPWRQAGTGVLPGDAKLIIPAGITLPQVFKKSGYATAIVGKWHLGLGSQVEKNWNEPIPNGPNNTGFDYSFIFPATADRVPTVFLENQQLVAGDAADPIQVDYQKKTGTDPTGAENPELLRMKASPNHGHNNTIVNGIGRIGFMTGGNKARWRDEELTYTFVDKAKQFIASHGKEPFFLYYAATEPHVPRMPATQFKGKSGLGYRGDAILQLDWLVGELMHALDAAGLSKNTIIIFSSDNGPVLDDGYQDSAAIAYHGEQLGSLRGGKYSVLEGGTRVPFIVSWPGQVKAGKSDAMICQIDLLASFAGFFHQTMANGEAPDSENQLDALLNKRNEGRILLVEGNTKDALAIISGDWKYIPPNNAAAWNKLVNIDLGNDPQPQLYNIKIDLGEKHNLASQNPAKCAELATLLETEKNRVKDQS